MSLATISNDKLLGAALIGFAVSSVLLGVFLAQVLQYWTRYQDDKLFYKILVLFIGILELFHHGLVSHILYYFTISHSGSLVTLLVTNAPWTAFVQTMIGVVIGVVVKICFCVRVWRFSKHNVLVTLPIFLLVIAELVLSILFVIRMFQLKKLIYFYETKTIGSLALGCGVVVDVGTAMVLWYYLQKLKAGYQSATTVILKISIYAVSTGVMTSAVGLATLLSFYLMPDNFIFVAIFFLLSKVYGVSLLAALNTRRSLFPDASVVYHADSEFYPSDSFTPLPPTPRVSRMRRPSMESRTRLQRERSLRAPYNYSTRTLTSLEPAARYYSHCSTSAMGSSEMGGLHGSRFSVVST